MSDECWCGYLERQRVVLCHFWQLLFRSYKLVWFYVVDHRASHGARLIQRLYLLVSAFYSLD